MKDETNKAWYVSRRGILLAEQFLLELQPNQLSSVEGPVALFDYMAFFLRQDGTLITIAVEVKATQQPIKDRFGLHASQIERLVKSNLPVLLVVANVKQNEIFFNWIKDAIHQVHVMPRKQHVIPVPLRKATNDEKEKLRKEILNL
jgi:hypothetical protein